MANQSEYLREIQQSIKQLQAIVDEMVERMPSRSCGSSGSNTIDYRSEIGSLNSPTATTLVDGYQNNIQWNIISLVRGMLSELMLIQKTVALLKNTVDQPTYNSDSVDIRDFSGTIQIANSSSLYSTGVQERKYLLIQNLNIQPIGNLWVNFGGQANIGAGCILLTPGEKLVFDGSAIPTDNVAILGTVVGMQFTYKEAGVYINQDL